MRPLLITFLCLILTSCGRSPPEDHEPVDAGQDGEDAADADTDAGLDAGIDAGEDAGEDAGVDAGEDAGVDAGEDAGVDAGEDAGGDAGDDAGEDAGGDAGVDAGEDAGGDTGEDAGEDAGVDDGQDGDGDDDGDGDGDGDGAWVVESYSYQIINSYPHDMEAYTQGLVIADGRLYEGTGLRGSSSLRRVELETGEVLQIHELEAQYFGEGVAAWQDKLLQLTYTSQIGFVYDRETFEQLDTFSYPTQGWGLTHDGTRLILSDGSPNLYFLDPVTFEQIDSVEVYDPAGPVHRLNELEYIDGQVYANIWTTNRIVIIDPLTGRVSGDVDLTGLLSPQDCTNSPNWLNGIAYDPVDERLFVTGKFWCKLFEIELVLQ